MVQYRTLSTCYLLKYLINTEDVSFPYKTCQLAGMSSSNYTVTILKDQLLNKSEIKIRLCAWNNGIWEPSVLSSQQSQGPWPGRPIMPSSLAICNAWLLCQNAVISTALSQSFNLYTTSSLCFIRFLRCGHLYVEHTSLRCSIACASSCLLLMVVVLCRRM